MYKLEAIVKTHRILITILLTLIFVSTSFGTIRIPENQYKYQRETVVGFGFLVPSDGEFDLTLNGAYHWRLDNSVIHGPNFLWYNNKFTQEGSVWGQSTPGWSSTTYTTEYETRLTLLSPGWELGIEFDMFNTPKLTQFVKVGIGFDMLWAKETNNLHFVPGDTLANGDPNYRTVEDSDFLFGWRYELCAGAKLQLGEKTNLYGLLGYRKSAPSRKEDETAGLPTTTEINMSGFRMEIGVIYHFWKQ